MRPLTAAPVSGESSTQVLRISGADEATAVARVAWPDPGDATTVLLSARLLDGDGTTPPRVLLAGRAKLAQGTEIAAERIFEPNESATLLFEIGRRGKSRPLTFAVAVEIELRPTIALPRTPGAPVQLTLEIQRVLDGRVIPLETNTLSTFVGEAVSYGFRLGDGGAAEAFEIRLRPVELAGGTAILDLEIAGTHPGADRVDVVGRRQSWITSRDAVSTFAIESGDPPTGWRFLVTPRF